MICWNISHRSYRSYRPSVRRLMLGNHDTTRYNHVCCPFLFIPISNHVRSPSSSSWRNGLAINMLDVLLLYISNTPNKVMTGFFVRWRGSSSIAVFLFVCCHTIRAVAHTAQGKELTDWVDRAHHKTKTRTLPSGIAYCYCLYCMLSIVYCLLSIVYRLSSTRLLSIVCQDTRCCSSSIAYHGTWYRSRSAPRVLLHLESFDKQCWMSSHHQTTAALHLFVPPRWRFTTVLPAFTTVLPEVTTLLPEVTDWCYISNYDCSTLKVMVHIVG